MQLAKSFASTPNPQFSRCASLRLRARAWRYTAAVSVAPRQHARVFQSRRQLWCCDAAATTEKTAEEQTQNTQGDKKSFSLKFLLTSEAASFVGRDGGRHLASLGEGLHVTANLCPPNNKAMRSLEVQSLSPSAVAEFLDKLLLQGEEAGQAVLDKTKDGKRLKLKALIPSNLVGFLLGNGGKRIKGINKATDCFINVQERSTADTKPLSPQSKPKPYRMLALAGSRKSLVQAVKTVLIVLCKDGRFFRVHRAEEFISVPMNRSQELDTLLVDLAKTRSKAVARWVNLPKSLQGQDVKVLFISGRSAAVAQAKQQVDAILASPPAPAAGEISATVASSEEKKREKKKESVVPDFEAVSPQEDVPEELKETAAMPS